MKRVGYDETSSIIATAVTCAIGSIVAAFVTDMPFIIAPPTSVSIFLAVSMQQQGQTKNDGNAAVILSGAGLAFIGALPPVTRFLSKVCDVCPRVVQHCLCFRDIIIPFAHDINRFTDITSICKSTLCSLFLSASKLHWA
jgi:xanthine/uracil/vitamin C permease (AzgA family)